MNEEKCSISTAALQMLLEAVLQFEASQAERALEQNTELNVEAELVPDYHEATISG